MPRRIHTLEAWARKVLRLSAASHGCTLQGVNGERVLYLPAVMITAYPAMARRS
jgi:hypothetical protein